MYAHRQRIGRRRSASIAHPHHQRECCVIKYLFFVLFVMVVLERLQNEREKKPINGRFFDHRHQRIERHLYETLVLRSITTGGNQVNGKQLLFSERCVCRPNNGYGLLTFKWSITISSRWPAAMKWKQLTAKSASEINRLADGNRYMDIHHLSGMEGTGLLLFFSIGRNNRNVPKIESGWNVVDTKRVWQPSGLANNRQGDSKV